MRKFKMELVWHNCKTYPPEEDSNDFLIVSDGINVCEAKWNKKEGFSYKSSELLNHDNLWWADLRQTVRGESKFSLVKGD